MLDTPRTTVVAAVLQGTTATWIHCGDSRLYVVRDGELLTRTRDHSYHAEQPRANGGSERRQPQHAPNLPGLRPPRRCSTSRGLYAATAAGRQASCCAPTACGACLDDLRRSCAWWPASAWPMPVPDLVEMRAAQGRRPWRQRHADRDGVGNPRRFRVASAAFPPTSITDGVFASTIQAGMPA